MIEALLCDAIAMHIREKCDVTLPVPNRSPDGELSYVKPMVCVGYIPPKSSAVSNYSPFVLVRADGATSTRERTSVKVSIIIAVYCDEKTPDAGYVDCINLMGRVRDTLMSLPTPALDDRYILEDGISWKTYDEQPWPRYQIDMETTWTIRAAEHVDPHGEYM